MLSRLGGGIGTRGPGETQLETDRRRIRQRLGALAREIDRVRRRRAQLRERRHKALVPTVELVGYTNAGKTTLFHQLTRERATTSDTLFVTLDPLVRQVKLPDGRRLLVSDTVGFIERLPHALVAAFRATLEEAAEADVLLHVIDASGPDRERLVAAVGRVLAEMDAARVPVIPVYNKCDRLDAAALERLRRSDGAALCVSALRGDGCRELLEAVSAQVALDTRRVRLEFDASSEADRRRIASLYRHGRVHRHVAADGRVSIEADVPRRLLATLTDQS
jgi:GTP-binding protein HflX